MSTARPAGILVHSGRGLLDWLTGTGFLTLNALCFFGALVTLIPWNIYSDPGDFWSADILIRWAFLLGFHALLVATLILIRNVILKDDNPIAEMTPTARQWHAARARNTSSSIDFRTAPAQSSAAAATASTLYAQEWARSQSEQVQIAVNEPVESSMKSSAPSGSVDVGELLADWDTSWPEPVTPDAEHAGSIERDVVPTEEVDILLGVPPPQRSPGPLSAAARASSTSAESSAVNPELEWQWIEAAASAWLTRREHEPPSPQSSGGSGH